MIHKAKKYLGQNFLKSTLALNKIVESGEISIKDIILEIGPGKGALTEKLLKKAKQVIAIEKDKDLFNFLQTKFAKEIKNKKLILIEKDILDFDINNILHNYKIIANIPYNITGAILKKFLSEKNQPKNMVLMVQNEVAKRIVARDGKESILSISVKAYGNPKMVMKVPARYFSPSPNVDSAVIIIKNISKKNFTKNRIDEEKFWEIIHTGFAHKRKKLSSNLKIFMSKIPLNIEVNIKTELKNKRAEELTFTDWINLFKKIHKYQNK